MKHFQPSQNTRCFIFYAKRTPIGKLGGGLSSIRPDDLLSFLLEDFKIKYASSFSLEEVEDVFVGCSNQAGEDNRNIARMSLLLANYPYSIPGITLNRLCASSLSALAMAYTHIIANQHECLLVGGVESMSRAPYVFSKATKAFSGEQEFFNTTLGWRFPNPRMAQRFPLFSMGQTAEVVAKELNITREEQDLFAFHSHQKAIKAQTAGYFSSEIIPIKLPKGEILEKDEGPRANTSLEQLAKLSPVFETNGSGSVTAGNSSPLNDGGALLGVCSEEFLKRHSLIPLLEVHCSSSIGLEPNRMGLGPVKAIQTLLPRLQWKLDELDALEINEAFAAQVLGVAKEIKIPLEKINLLGGAIALGHPLGASGARIACTLAHQFQKNSSLKKAIASMCVGVGQGVALGFSRAN